MKNKQEISKKISKKERNSGMDTLDIILLVGVPVLIIIIWEVLSREGILPTAVMPAPSRIISRFREVWEDGSLQKDILVSATRIFKGFLAGTLAGIVLGIIISLSRRIDMATTVLVNVLRPIPIIALFPLFILWFGIDEKSKVVVIGLGTFWSVLLNTIQGIKRADQKLIEVAKVLKLPHWKIVWKIILPSAFPYIYTGVRLGVGNALACVVTAEMVAASEGLGYMIMYARMMAQPDVLLVGVITLGLFGILIEVGMVQLQKHLFKY